MNLFNILLIFSLSQTSVYVNEQNNEYIASSKVVQEKNSKTNNIYVCLSNAESLKLNDYENNFFDISYEDISEITQRTTNLLKEKRDYNLINTSNFKRIFKIQVDQNMYNLLTSDLCKFKYYDEFEFIQEDKNTTFTLCQAVENDNNLNYSNWALDKINASSVWDEFTIHSTPKIGVIDSGIYSEHPNLTNNINKNQYFESDIGFALNPASSHGTNIAGILGGHSSESDVFSGVCKDVELISMQILAGGGNTSEENKIRVSNAINYAITNNISILNMSYCWTENDLVLKTLLESYNGLIVCAAGNDYVNLDDYPTYPACYDLDNTICVGASNESDSIWTYTVANTAPSHGTGITQEIIKGSNYSQNFVDIFAPGVNITSTEIDQNNLIKENHYSSTSIATPFVTATAALLKAHNPAISSSEIKSQILNSADKISSLSQYSQLGKRLNSFNSFFKYTWLSYTSHKKICICGEWTNVPHIVSSGTLNSSTQYAPCLLCDGMAFVGFTEIQALTNQEYYFLPNNVIVVSNNDTLEYVNRSVIYEK